MSDKIKSIKDGENIELDGVTVLNNVSVAEKEEKKVEEAKETPVIESEQVVAPEIPSIEIPTQVDEPETSSNDTTIIPQGPVEVNFPSNDVEPIPVAPTIDPTLSSAFNTNFTQVPYSMENKTPLFNNQDTFESNPFNNNQNTFENIKYNNYSNEGEGNTIFKTPEEIDKAMDLVLKDVASSYEKYLSGPTKVLVDFVNKFLKWGNEVTANGLNRRLFDEFDELVDMVKKTSSALDGIDMSAINKNDKEYDYSNSKSFTDSYGQDFNNDNRNFNM